MGVLIPSPLVSHTHGVALHPFDPNALLTVKDSIEYLSEHAIDALPLEEQAIQHAGQVVVAREMAKLRHLEVQARRLKTLPEIKLSIHRNPKVKPVGEFMYWRKILGWTGSLDANE